MGTHGLKSEFTTLAWVACIWLQSATSSACLLLVLPPSMLSLPDVQVIAMTMPHKEPGQAYPLSILTGTTCMALHNVEVAQPCS